MKGKPNMLNAPIYSIALTLWSTAIFFSYLSSRFDYSKIDLFYFFTFFLPLIASVSFLLSKEKKVSGTLFLLVSFLTAFVLDLPLVPNHRYVLFFASILIVLPILLSPKNEESYFVTQTVTHIRALTIIVYSFAFFSKLNWDYLNLDKSCAIVFFRHIQDLNNFPLHSEIIDLLVIYGSLVIEFLIPLLILLRFYSSALILGIVFHFILALDIFKYFTNFSSVMAFLLFVSGGQLALKVFKINSSFVIEKVFKTKKIFNIFFTGWLSIILMSSVIVDLSGGVFEGKEILLFVTFRHLLWLVFGFFLLFTSYRLFLVTKIFNREESSEKSFSYSKVALLVLFLAFFNGMTPFIGLKSRTGFNMYGNMRIEPGFSNHLLVGRIYGTEKYMRDTGIVLAAEEGMICGHVLYPNTEYPIFEILRAIQNCKNENIKFEYDGRVFESNSEEVAALVKQKTSGFSRKLLTFKPLGLKSETECIW